MTSKKDTLYWSRGCTTELNDNRELICTSIEDCHKLTVHNWLENIPFDKDYDIYEIRFKNTRKGFYRNVNGLKLKEGDIVAVEASPGHDIGIVSALGPVAEIKLSNSGLDPSTVELKKIYRQAKSGDIEKWQEAVSLEYPTMIRTRQMANMLGLNMKIGDVDFQGDKTKAIFYYIADERVDFRELIKIMAEAFHIRIEMRQIGARQEAGLIGGIGPCGRELCCAQWMTDFISVSTNSVRHQEISVNPLKLAGQCSKLKCCLNFELDTYLDAIKNFPIVREPLQTVDGPIFLQKTDVLKSLMWFSAGPGSMSMVSISVNSVKEIIDLNKKGEKVDITIYSNNNSENAAPSEFKSAVGEDSLTRFDKTKKNNKNRSKNRSSDDRDRTNKNKDQSLNSNLAKKRIEKPRIERVEKIEKPSINTENEVSEKKSNNKKRKYFKNKKDQRPDANENNK